MTEVAETPVEPTLTAAAARRRHLVALVRQVYDSQANPPTLQRLRALMITQHRYLISVRTLRRYLLQGATRYNRRSVPRILRANYGKRQAWAADLVQSRAAFERIVFSDEKLFVVEPADQGSKVAYLVCEDDPRRLRPTAGRERMCLMVFGLFTSAAGRFSTPVGDLCIVPHGSDGTVSGAIYLQVLRDFVTPFMAELGDGFVLLEDNASSHRATGHIPMPFERIRHGAYPVHSPDFNAIERMWAMVNSSVRKGMATESEGLISVRHLRNLIRRMFIKVCMSPAALRALESTWDNLQHAATHLGRQRPTS